MSICSKAKNEVYTPASVLEVGFMFLISSIHLMFANRPFSFCLQCGHFPLALRSLNQLSMQFRQYSFEQVGHILGSSTSDRQIWHSIIEPSPLNGFASIFDDMMQLLVF
jgi:hypothetical protein